MHSSSSRVGIIRCDTDWVVKEANSTASGLLGQSGVAELVLQDRLLSTSRCGQPGRGYPLSRFVPRPGSRDLADALLVHVATSEDGYVVTFEPAAWSLAILAQLDAAVLATDEAGSIVFVHPGDPGLPAVVPASWLGCPVAEASVSYLPADGLSMRQIAEVMSGKAERDHVRLRLADGLTHSLSIRRLPWRYRGCSCGILIIVTDVTHVAEALARDSTAMAFQLWHTLQHELRNPLQTMEAAVELLGPVVAGSGALALRVLREQIETMSAYLSDQMLVGLPAAGPMSPGRLSTVVSQEIERASLRLFTAQLTFDHQVMREEPPIRLQGYAMGRLFANLFRNAAQARPDAHITIAYGMCDGHVVCTVADDGPGFPPAVLSTDWVRRTQPTRHLGLALAVSTLAAHGGTMRLANREGGGAGVTLVLPCAYARAAEVGA